MILNINKPKNWTSFDVVAKVRGILREKKAGHAGTLDPLAEGVLIILTGEDTKRQQEFMGMEKKYVAEIAFGVSSPTYDLEMTPKLVSTPEIKGTYEDVKKIIPEFVGEISQRIPFYSAKKVGGKAMYKLARKGIEVPEQTKKVEIKSIEIIEQDVRQLETDRGLLDFPVVVIKVRCSSGTFIRSLAQEMGERLGTGGVLVSLVRSAIGDYKIEDAIKIEDLSSQRSL